VGVWREWQSPASPGFNGDDLGASFTGAKATNSGRGVHEVKRCRLGVVGDMVGRPMGRCVLAGDKGGKRGCPDFSGDCLQRGAGDRGARVFGSNGREENGEHGDRSSAGCHCCLQFFTVASGDGAGEVFAIMAARARTRPNDLKIGGMIEGREGVLGVCSGGQGEVKRWL